MQRGAVFAGGLRELAKVAATGVLEQTHLLGQEVVQEPHPCLLPPAQPDKHVPNLFGDLVRQVVKPQLSLFICMYKT